MKLIDAEDLAAKLRERREEQTDDFAVAILGFVEAMVSKEDEAIVRCRDCRDYKGVCYGYGDNGYCSEGRRKRC